MAKKSGKSFLGALRVVGIDPYAAGAEGESLITPSIDEIVPDFDQPRHVVPADIRHRLQEDETTPAKAMEQMWKRCLTAGRFKKMVSGKLTPLEALDEQQAAGPRDVYLHLTLGELAELATSIALHGQRQPITLYRKGKQLQIGEGERRWWAHVHLHHILGVEEARTIVARLDQSPVDDLVTLARQHAENAIRTDLSAVARARAIARVHEAVVRDISGTARSQNGETAPGEEVSGTGRSQNTDKSGRPRTHADATTHEIDELTGQRMGTLTGRAMSGRRVRQMLALLRLPPEAQALAEAANLSEWGLRPITRLGKPAVQLTRVRTLAEQALGVEPTGTASASKTDTGKGEPATAQVHLSRLRSSLRFAAEEMPDALAVAGEIKLMSEKKRQELVARARRYAAFVQSVLSAVDSA